MIAPKLDGVLAIRQSWCLPDEDVLLCAESRSIGFDVAGLDAQGRPDRGVGGRAFKALGFAAARGRRDRGLSLPYLVVFGPSAAAEAPTACADLGGPGPVWCVLTPLRLAWVRAVEDRPEPDRSVLGQVRGLPKIAREIPVGRGAYPAHRPVETADVWSAAEVPSARIASVTTAEREYATRHVHVLRVALVDGSGVDVVAGPLAEHALRLFELATGEQ